jgi:hypothetical protein
MIPDGEETYIEVTEVEEDIVEEVPIFEIVQTEVITVVDVPYTEIVQEE